MNSIVCIKQVPETKEIRLDPKTGKLVREGIPSIINPEDKNAIEEAIRLKELFGGIVTVITMGPPQAEEALREALAMGADKAVLLSDRDFGGADTAATSYILGCGIKKLGSYDLVLCGTESIDGSTAHVGPQLAETLGIPQITYTNKIKINGDGIEAKKAVEGGYEIVKTKLPALITVLKEINEVREAALTDVLLAYREKEVIIWSANDINSQPEKTGIKGSYTETRKLNSVNFNREGIKIMEGSITEASERLIAELTQRNLL